LVSEIGWPINPHTGGLRIGRLALGSRDNPPNTDAVTPFCVARPLFCNPELYRASFAECGLAKSLKSFTKTASENRSVGGSILPLGTISFNGLATLWRTSFCTSLSAGFAKPYSVFVHVLSPTPSTHDAHPSCELLRGCRPWHWRGWHAQEQPRCRSH
jgi:hypothetical protein